MKKFKIFLLISTILLSTGYAKSDPPTLKEALNRVTRAYLDVKNALITNKVSTTQNKAMDFINALNAVPDKYMTPSQHDTWFDYLNKLAFDSRHISESGTIDHQREHFASLSDNLYKVLKMFNINSIILYLQYSPKDKTYWISETAAIKNPYY